MSSRKVRIGIDVGGTFTDAVVVDNETYEVIAKEKCPTTHHAKQGVAEGIVRNNCTCDSRAYTCDCSHKKRKK